MSKALFRRHSGPSRVTPEVPRFSNRTVGITPLSKSIQSSRTDSSTDAPHGRQSERHKASVSPNVLENHSGTRRRSLVARRPSRKSPADLAKVVADRIDSWTKLYTDNVIPYPIPPMVPIPPVPIFSELDDSTLIDWGSNLDFSELIDTMATD